MIAKVKELEDELENLPARQDAASSGFSSNAPASIPPQELQTKADKARVLMVKGIKSQMKVSFTIRLGRREPQRGLYLSDLPKMLPYRLTSTTQWKPSCKIGNAKFSYSGALPSTQVFAALTRQDADEKKVKKNVLFTSEEFGDKVAKTDIQASVRYDYLFITSKNVSLRWKEEDLTFTVSGSYGKSMRE